MTGRPRNAHGEALICADCGHQSIVPLAEICLRWKTAVSLYGWRSQRGDGASIPTGYGIAYYEADRAVMVIMPLPFNLIVGWLRALRWHIQCPPWRFAGTLANRARQQGYEEGVRDGDSDGFERGYALGVERTLRRFHETSVERIVGEVP